MAVVQRHFKPEFLNRLDDVVVFHALSTEELTHIVDIQIDVLRTRLAKRRLTLDVADAAREWLALNGFDPVYGARPLRRLVQSAIGDQLARELLAGDVREGDTVRVDLDPTAEGGTGGLVVGRALRRRSDPAATLAPVAGRPPPRKHVAGRWPSCNRGARRATPSPTVRAGLACAAWAFLRACGS
jgi:ATP-dependent Clp protease ATP-binding subunit ClpB